MRSMERFIRHENVRHYRDPLKLVTDETNGDARLNCLKKSKGSSGMQVIRPNSRSRVALICTAGKSWFFWWA